MKTCATCNASHNNTVERVLRCMGCVAKQGGNTNWRPVRHNVQAQPDAQALLRGSAGATGSAAADNGAP